MADMRLWTPVANAYEAYRRRLIADPSSVYEHLWRLIHIHESLVVMLGSAFASRLLASWKDVPSALSDANRLRRKVTGLSSPTDPNPDSDLSNGDACLDGYIKPWIDMLKSFTSIDIAAATPFCRAVSEYASHSPDHPVAFLEAWKKISEVPQVFSGTLSRIDRYDAINTLRNKLAHVPLPHKVLQELHWGLRQEVLSLLTAEYKAGTDSVTSDFETTKWHSVLRGRLLCGKHYVNGSAFGLLGNSDQAPQGRALLHWQNGNDAQSGEKWEVSPFIRMDSELKVSLLFLLNDIRNDSTAEDYKGEYHRFAAELMPVEKDRVSRDLVTGWIPCRPSPLNESVEQHALESANTGAGPVSESNTQDEATENPQDASAESNVQHQYSPQTQSTDSQLRNSADSAFRMRDYQGAVENFVALATTGNMVLYNDVARSKHGAALWRFAEMNVGSTSERLQLFDEAISLLESATRHRDPDYRARAYYEKSKALWHKWKCTLDPEQLQQAKECANEAATLQYAPALVSWYEKILDDIEDSERPIRSASDAKVSIP